MKSKKKPKTCKKKSKKFSGCKSTGFPKCGKEGCVYLDENPDLVNKKEWKFGAAEVDYKARQNTYQLKASEKSFAPAIIEQNIIPCVNIKTDSHSDKCIIKNKNSVYEESQSPDLCQNWGKDHICKVDDILYNMLLDQLSEKGDRKKMPVNVTLPDSDVNDDGSFKNTVESRRFINFNPIYLFSTKNTRVKGLTFEEYLYKIKQYDESIFDKEQIQQNIKLWTDELDTIIRNITALTGKFSEDFYSMGNYMIDVNDETLCDYIDQQLDEFELITPEMIRKHYKIDPSVPILKIVDWGLLT